MRRGSSTDGLASKRETLSSRDAFEAMDKNTAAEPVDLLSQVKK
jgi:hypothetical protein